MNGIEACILFCIGIYVLVAWALTIAGCSIMVHQNNT